MRFASRARKGLAPDWAASAPRRAIAWPPGEGLETADLAAPADLVRLLGDPHVPDVARRALSAAMQVAVRDESCADSGADLDEDRVLDVKGDATPQLAQGEHVHVVVDPGRCPESGREAHAHGVAVPAGHDRRRRGRAHAELHGARQADADAPHAGPWMGREQRVEDLLHLAQDGLGPGGDVDRLATPLDDLAGQIGEGCVDGGRAELGDEQHPEAGS